MHVRHHLARQLDTSWSLLGLHLSTLEDGEALWRPAEVGLHVHQGDGGVWAADWPEREGYASGPSSIAWLTWHIGFWWSMVLDHSFATGSLQREDVPWTGSASGARQCLQRCHDDWVMALDALSDSDYDSTARTRWPVRQRPFADVVAWVNVELMKNAAEIGYARFLYAVRPQQSAEVPVVS